MKTAISTTNKSPSTHNLRQLREALLISWAKYHGPRGKEIQTATWSPDNSGNFYKTDGNWYYQYTSISFSLNRKSRKRIEYQLAPEAAEKIDRLLENLSTTQAENIKLFPGYPRIKPKNFSFVMYRNILASSIFEATTNELHGAMLALKFNREIYEKYI